MHESSYKLCESFVNNYLSTYLSLKVADCGSFDVNGTYRPLFTKGNYEYRGFDIQEGPNVDTVVDFESDTIPEKESFDVVISGQCMEHVRRPFAWMRGIASLAGQGGLVWVCAPNTWHYHEHPIDCWRVYPEGMKACMEDAGLEVIECTMVGFDTYGVARKKPVQALAQAKI